MESWDDDLDLQGPIVTNTQQSAKTSLSVSSRRSFRSDSNAGDEDWQLPLSPTDPQSTSDAISHAKQAGIPLPDNVPSSALVGGSIKKLGNKKSQTKGADNDDWAEDLEMPDADAGALTLKPVRKEAPSQIQEHDDFSDWAEGSLGIRTGGTRRTSKNRSSSISAMSPSMGSCMTFESEEDGLEGLIIPNGPVDFENTLKKRKEEGLNQDDAHDAVEDEPQTIRPKSTSKGHDDDNLDDLDFGPDGVLDSKNHIINRNVKTSWKQNHTSSPASRAHTTLTFSDRPAPTRLPRPVSSNKPPTRLEPVMESGATNITKPRRAEPTHSNARALRSKRSMPNLYSQRSAGANATPSATATNDQKPLQQAPQIMSFKQRQSNILQGHGRHNSDPHRATSPIARPTQRPLSGQPPETPTRNRKDVAPTSLAKEAAAKKAVTRPTKRRNFGDGTELDLFDDLPTSTAKENKFTKQPNVRPKSVALRSQVSESRLGMRDKMTTPTMQGPPQTPKSPAKADSLPRFARDTAASRNAREQKASLPSKRSESVLTSRTNWPSQIAARSPTSSPRDRKVAKKGPTLINPMGKENIRHFQDDAEKKGMQWNPVFCRWEGNESALKTFEPNHHRPNSGTTQATVIHAPPSPPRAPALITNPGNSAAQGVQVVGGMVFDPTRMCWLKLGRRESQQYPLSPTSLDEDEDPFKDIEDLKESKDNASAIMSVEGGRSSRVRVASGSGTAVAGTTPGDWPVGEEFDLGPGFIHRQREAEKEWRERVGAWFLEANDHSGPGPVEVNDPDGVWKWSVRDVADGFVPEGMTPVEF